MLSIIKIIICLAFSLKTFCNGIVRPRETVAKILYLWQQSTATVAIDARNRCKRLLATAVNATVLNRRKKVLATLFRPTATVLNRCNKSFI